MKVLGCMFCGKQSGDCTCPASGGFKERKNYMSSFNKVGAALEKILSSKKRERPVQI